jgi:hypothetical protein
VCSTEGKWFSDAAKGREKPHATAWLWRASPEYETLLQKPITSEQIS